MKFRAKGNELLEGFQLAASVVGPRASREVTRNTKLSARKQGSKGKPEVTVYAIGEENSLLFRLEPIELKEEGDVVLPGETMVGVLREVRAQEVEIKVADRSCEIRLENSFFKVLGEDPGGFPEEMRFEGERALALSGPMLRSMLSRIVFASSNEDSRYAMNGILFSPEDGALDLVATDGRRLAYVQGRVAESRKAEAVIVPRVSINHALKMLPQAGEVTVRLLIAESQFAIESDNCVLFSRLIDGKFPPHKEVIPKTTTFSVQFPVAVLQAAVRQASLLTDASSRTVRFTFSGSTLEISARTADKGEARITVPIEYDRDDFTLYFNPDFIADCLKVLETETVTFSFTDASRQAVVTDGAGFVYIVMPVTPSSA